MVLTEPGLGDLMMAAGLTHGGFYKHFASKEQVIEESITLGIESMIDAWRRTLSGALSHALPRFGRLLPRFPHASTHSVLSIP
jgi:AcrR family transcriptional regulator